MTVFDRDVVVKIDFEKAVIGALSSKRCHVSGCFFHFAQSIYKNVRKKCWNVYKTNQDAKRLCSVLVQMAFLSLDQIDAVAPLMNMKMVSCGLGILLQYFSRTFLSEMFPPETWCSQRISERTNNRCESFHSSIVKTFPNHGGKPSFGEVVNCINLTMTHSREDRDTHPSRTAKLESENRFIERVLEKYSRCLDANDIFRCLETLSMRKTASRSIWTRSALEWRCPVRNAPTSTLRHRTSRMNPGLQPRLHEKLHFVAINNCFHSFLVLFLYR